MIYVQQKFFCFFYSTNIVISLAGIIQSSKTFMSIAYHHNNKSCQTIQKAVQTLKKKKRGKLSSSVGCYQIVYDHIELQFELSD